MAKVSVYIDVETGSYGDMANIVFVENVDEDVWADLIEDEQDVTDFGDEYGITPTEWAETL